MKRIVLLVMLLMVWGIGISQNAPLTQNQLEREKWYTSLEEALMEPEKVYKLKLRNQKIRKLPPEIGMLNNLQILDVSRNRIEELPPEIGKLKHLEELNLFKNRLRFLPKDFRRLNRLNKLYMGRNRLSSIPVWVGGMGNLRILDVTLNRLTPLEIDKAAELLPKCQISF